LRRAIDNESRCFPPPDHLGEIGHRVVTLECESSLKVDFIDRPDWRLLARVRRTGGNQN